MSIMGYPGMQKWPLNDPAGQVIALYNLREYDALRKTKSARCIQCDYVCSSNPAERFAIAGMEPVCNLCSDMYKALTFNPGMRNMNYFREIQEAEDKAKQGRNNQRRRMGLDDEGWGA